MAKLHEGYLMVDHRGSPGLSNDPLRGEGKLFETSTMHCVHCGTVVITNPFRTRERSYCPKCDSYICDNCALATRLPDYQHKTYKQHLDETLTKGLIQNYG
jgi:hypothetical protein